jgi:hypothetical protein
MLLCLQVGDRVRVINGTHQGEIGMVVLTREVRQGGQGEWRLLQLSRPDQCTHLPAVQHIGLAGMEGH